MTKYSNIARVACTIALATASSCQHQDDRSSGNDAKVIPYLRQYLTEVGAVGRLYYDSPCRGRSSGNLPFPDLGLKPATAAKGLEAISQLFRNEKDVAVSESRSRIVSVAVGLPQTQILRTKMTHIYFTLSARYNPYLAILAIEAHPSLVAANRALGIQPDNRVVDILVTPPLEGLPHLPDSMNDVTLDQALDSVATTFKGIVVYGTCPHPLRYQIDFAFIGK